MRSIVSFRMLHIKKSKQNRTEQNKTEHRCDCVCNFQYAISNIKYFCCHLWTNVNGHVWLPIFFSKNCNKFQLCSANAFIVVCFMMLNSRFCSSSLFITTIRMLSITSDTETPSVSIYLLNFKMAAPGFYGFKRSIESISKTHAITNSICWFQIVHFFPNFDPFPNHCVCQICSNLVSSEVHMAATAGPYWAVLSCRWPCGDDWSLVVGSHWSWLSFVSTVVQLLCAAFLPALHSALLSRRFFCLLQLVFWFSISWIQGLKL